MLSRRMQVKLEMKIHCMSIREIRLSARDVLIHIPS